MSRHNQATGAVAMTTAREYLTIDPTAPDQVFAGAAPALI
jgi:hypothetical protein